MKYKNMISCQKYIPICLGVAYLGKYIIVTEHAEWDFRKKTSSSMWLFGKFKLISISIVCKLKIKILKSKSIFIFNLQMIYFSFNHLQMIWFVWKKKKK